MSVSQEILDFRFLNFADSTSRHTVFVRNLSISNKLVAGYGSVYFNGASYLQLIDNDLDWMLGSTINNSRVSTRNWAPTKSDNNFTIDTWIYPTTSSSRYYPICSSFKSKWWTNSQYDLGWVFRIDMLTGRLQLISYIFGSYTNRVIESFGTVQLDQWTHIALMSWTSGNGSSKLFYINGQPAGARNVFSSEVRSNVTGSIETEFFPISNLVSHESQFGTAGDPDFSPFYIGLGPRTSLTNPDLDSSFYFKKEYGIGLNAYLGRFRICLGNRYQSGVSFNPLETIVETSSSTSTTTTTSTSMTTMGERGEIPLVASPNDLLVLKLRNNCVDLTNRHYVKPIGETNFSISDLGCKSLHFDGSNYLQISLNQKDFSLGSTLVSNHYDERVPVCLPNNKFSLDFWINPDSSGNWYPGICSSFSTYFFPTDISDTVNYGPVRAQRDFRLGWSLQLDSSSGKLQFISYAFGLVKDVFISGLLIPNDQWTHVAIMSVPGEEYSSKYIFINGVPDSVNPHNNPDTFWTNGVHRSSVNVVVDSHACLFIGLGANTYIEDKSLMLDYRQGNMFCGNLSSFRLSSDLRYPTDGSGFIPYRIPDITTTTSTMTTISTTETTTVTSTTAPPVGYVAVEGKAIASSSQYDGKPQYVTDDNIDSVWKPVTATEAWIGIECE